MQPNNWQGTKNLNNSSFVGDAWKIKSHVQTKHDRTVAIENNSLSVELTNIEQKQLIKNKTLVVSTFNTIKSYKHSSEKFHSQLPWRKRSIKKGETTSGETFFLTLGHRELWRCRFFFSSVALCFAPVVRSSSPNCRRSLFHRARTCFFLGGRGWEIYACKAMNIIGYILAMVFGWISKQSRWF